MDGPEVGEARDFTSILIAVSQFEAESSDYKYYIENSLRLDSAFPDFKILERFSLDVAGESGEEVVYYYNNPRLESKIAKGIPPAPSIGRRIMFSHDDLLWRLEIHGLETLAEKDKTDFEHIVNTFQILD